MNSDSGYSKILSIQNATIYRAILDQYDAQLGQFPTPGIDFSKLSLTHTVNAGGMLDPKTIAGQDVSFSVNGGGTFEFPNDLPTSVGDSMPDEKTVRRCTFRIRYSQSTAASIAVNLMLGVDSTTTAYTFYRHESLGNAEVLNINDILILPGWKFWIDMTGGGAGDSVGLGGFCNYQQPGVEVPI
jgi:hypothetical protein